MQDARVHPISSLPANSPAVSSFDPALAFGRSLGWLTSGDLQILAKSHVGIIGMGGVGGQYAEVLARLGIGRFTVCDPDTFSIENTNRQNECKTSNYGRNKAEVIRELILDINPKAVVNLIPGAMKLDQVDTFCGAVDIYIDALDFFQIDLRIAIFRKMHQLGKPAITVAPVGAGAACVVFGKDSMSFDDYFGLHRTTDKVERSLMFLVGLAPSLQHASYIQDRSRLDFEKNLTPSLPIGVYACAAVAATNITKLLLGRGKVKYAPWSIHYDAYKMDIKKKYIFWGYRNPLQILRLKILKAMMPRDQKRVS